MFCNLPKCPGSPPAPYHCHEPLMSFSLIPLNLKADGFCFCYLLSDSSYHTYLALKYSINYCIWLYTTPGSLYTNYTQIDINMNDTPWRCAVPILQSFVKGCFVFAYLSSSPSIVLHSCSTIASISITFIIQTSHVISWFFCDQFVPNAKCSLFSLLIWQNPMSQPLMFFSAITSTVKLFLSHYSPATHSRHSK